MKMKIFFGTDGWRALNGSQINEVSVAVIAQAFSEKIEHQLWLSAMIAVKIRSCLRIFLRKYFRET